MITPSPLPPHSFPIMIPPIALCRSSAHYTRLFIVVFVMSCVISPSSNHHLIIISPLLSPCRHNFHNVTGPPSFQYNISYRLSIIVIYHLISRSLSNHLRFLIIILLKSVPLVFTSTIISHYKDVEMWPHGTTTQSASWIEWEGAKMDH